MIEDPAEPMGRKLDFLVQEMNREVNTIASKANCAEAAQLVVDKGSNALITVRCGQNAADVFKAAEIKIYKAFGSDAAENLKALAEGKLEELTSFHAGFHGKA